MGATAPVTLAILPALLPASAYAQTVAPTREELDRAGLRTPTTENQPTRLTVDGDIERAPCPLADPRFTDVKVTISGADFRNLGPVPAEALRSAWEGYVGREIPVAAVCEIRDSAATILRQMGYLAAVQVPPQRIEKDGVVQFDVLMAKLVGIQVRGDAGNSEKLIAAQLEAIKDQPAFNVRDAERHLLLARDLPGYEVRLSLRPANTAPGEVIGEVTVTRRAIQLEANVQNYGANPVGRFGGLARLQLNDLTGMGDSTVLSLFNTAQLDEQTVLQLGHNFAVGTDGLRLGGNLTYAWSKPDIVGGQLNTRSFIASTTLTYPLIRKQTTNLLGTLGFDYVDQDVNFGGSILTRDHLRVLFARADFDLIDPASLASTTGYSAAEPLWRMGGGVEIRQGVSIFNASNSCGPGPAFAACALPPNIISRQEGDPTAFVIRANATLEYRPIPGIAFTLSPRAQYSPNPLLSYEEFSTGNYTVGRGYDPGTFTGDSGVGVSWEVAFLSRSPRSANDVAIQPYAFFDAARVWNEDIGVPTQNLYSAGGGIRAVWGDKARIDMTVAAPLKKIGTPGNRGDVRFLISLTTQLVPWSY